MEGDADPPPPAQKEAIDHGDSNESASTESESEDDTDLENASQSNSSENNDRSEERGDDGNSPENSDANSREDDQEPKIKYYHLQTKAIREFMMDYYSDAAIDKYIKEAGDDDLVKRMKEHFQTFKTLMLKSNCPSTTNMQNQYFHDAYMNPDPESLKLDRSFQDFQLEHMATALDNHSARGISWDSISLDNRDLLTRVPKDAVVRVRLNASPNVISLFVKQGSAVVHRRWSDTINKYYIPRIVPLLVMSPLFNQRQLTDSEQLLPLTESGKPDFGKSSMYKTAFGRSTERNMSKSELLVIPYCTTPGEEEYKNDKGKIQRRILPGNSIRSSQNVPSLHVECPENAIPAQHEDVVQLAKELGQFDDDDMKKADKLPSCLSSSTRGAFLLACVITRIDKFYFGLAEEKDWIRLYRDLAKIAEKRKDDVWMKMIRGKEKCYPMNDYDLRWSVFMMMDVLYPKVHLGISDGMKRITATVHALLGRGFLPGCFPSFVTMDNNHGSLKKSPKNRIPSFIKEGKGEKYLHATASKGTVWICSLGKDDEFGEEQMVLARSMSEQEQEHQDQGVKPNFVDWLSSFIEFTVEKLQRLPRFDRSGFEASKSRERLDYFFQGDSLEMMRICPCKKVDQIAAENENSNLFDGVYDKYNSKAQSIFNWLEEDITINNYCQRSPPNKLKKKDLTQEEKEQWIKDNIKKCAPHGIKDKSHLPPLHHGLSFYEIATFRRSLAIFYCHRLFLSTNQYAVSMMGPDDVVERGQSIKLSEKTFVVPWLGFYKMATRTMIKLLGTAETKKIDGFDSKMKLVQFLVDCSVSDERFNQSQFRDDSIGLLKRLLIHNGRGINSYVNHPLGSGVHSFLDKSKKFAIIPYTIATEQEIIDPPQFKSKLDSIQDVTVCKESPKLIEFPGVFPKLNDQKVNKKNMYAFEECLLRARNFLLDVVCEHALRAKVARNNPKSWLRGMYSPAVTWQCLKAVDNHGMFVPGYLPHEMLETTKHIFYFCYYVNNVFPMVMPAKSEIERFPDGSYTANLPMLVYILMALCLRDEEKNTGEEEKSTYQFVKMHLLSAGIPDESKGKRKSTKYMKKPYWNPDIPCHITVRDCDDIVKSFAPTFQFRRTLFTYEKRIEGNLWTEPVHLCEAIEILVRRRYKSVTVSNKENWQKFDDLLSFIPAKPERYIDFFHAMDEFKKIQYLVKGQYHHSLTTDEINKNEEYIDMCLDTCRLDKDGISEVDADLDEILNAKKEEYFQKERGERKERLEKAKQNKAKKDKDTAEKRDMETNKGKEKDDDDKSGEKDPGKESDAGDEDTTSRQTKRKRTSSEGGERKKTKSTDESERNITTRNSSRITQAQLDEVTFTSSGNEEDVGEETSGSKANEHQLAAQEDVVVFSVDNDALDGFGSPQKSESNLRSTMNVFSPGDRSFPSVAADSMGGDGQLMFDEESHETEPKDVFNSAGILGLFSFGPHKEPEQIVRDENISLEMKFPMNCQKNPLAMNSGKATGRDKVTRLMHRVDPQLYSDPKIITVINHRLALESILNCLTRKDRPFHLSIEPLLDGIKTRAINSGGLVRCKEALTQAAAACLGNFLDLCSLAANLPTTPGEHNQMRTNLQLASALNHDDIVKQVKLFVDSKRRKDDESSWNSVAGIYETFMDVLHTESNRAQKGSQPDSLEAPWRKPGEEVFLPALVSGNNEIGLISKDRLLEKIIMPILELAKSKDNKTNPYWSDHRTHALLSSLHVMEKYVADANKQHRDYEYVPQVTITPIRRRSINALSGIPLPSQLGGASYGLEVPLIEEDGANGKTTFMALPEYVMFYSFLWRMLECVNREDEEPRRAKQWLRNSMAYIHSLTLCLNEEGLRKFMQDDAFLVNQYQSRKDVRSILSKRAFPADENPSVHPDLCRTLSRLQEHYSFYGTEKTVPETQVEIHEYHVSACKLLVEETERLRRDVDIVMRQNGQGHRDILQNKKTISKKMKEQLDKLDEECKNTKQPKEEMMLFLAKIWTRMYPQELGVNMNDDDQPDNVDDGDDKKPAAKEMTDNMPTRNVDSTKPKQSADNDASATGKKRSVSTEEAHEENANPAKKGKQDGANDVAAHMDAIVAPKILANVDGDDDKNPTSKETSENVSTQAVDSNQPNPASGIDSSDYGNERSVPTQAAHAESANPSKKGEQDVAIDADAPKDAMEVELPGPPTESSNTPEPNPVFGKSDITLEKEGPSSGTQEAVSQKKVGEDTGDIPDTDEGKIKKMAIFDLTQEMVIFFAPPCPGLLSLILKQFDTWEKDHGDKREDFFRDMVIEEFKELSQEKVIELFWSGIKEPLYYQRMEWQSQFDIEPSKHIATEKDLSPQRFLMNLDLEKFKDDHHLGLSMVLEKCPFENTIRKSGMFVKLNCFNIPADPKIKSTFDAYCNQICGQVMNFLSSAKRIFQVLFWWKLLQENQDISFDEMNDKYYAEGLKLASSELKCCQHLKDIAMFFELKRNHHTDPNETNTDSLQNLVRGANTNVLVKFGNTETILGLLSLLRIVCQNIISVLMILEIDRMGKASEKTSKKASEKDSKKASEKVFRKGPFPDEVRVLLHESKKSTPFFAVFHHVRFCVEADLNYILFKKDPSPDIKGLGIKVPEGKYTPTKTTSQRKVEAGQFLTTVYDHQEKTASKKEKAPPGRARQRNISLPVLSRKGKKEDGSGNQPTSASAAKTTKKSKK